jgi:hypothetical protein
LNGTVSPEHYPGYTASVVAEFPVLDFFAFQPELSFIQKGYKMNFTILDTTLETRYILNYIEAPLLLKGVFGTETVKGYVLAGPTFGYAFNGFEKLDGQKNDISFEHKQRFEIGLQFGIGFGLDLGPGTFFLDGRYGLGITDVDDSKEFDIVWKNRGINIGMGYLYRIEVIAPE